MLYTLNTCTEYLKYRSCSQIITYFSVSDFEENLSLTSNLSLILKKSFSDLRKSFSDFEENMDKGQLMCTKNKATTQKHYEKIHYTTITYRQVHITSKINQRCNECKVVCQWNGCKNLRGFVRPDSLMALSYLCSSFHSIQSRFELFCLLIA